MRASFQGQNIFALGNGIAILRSAWTESDPPLEPDEHKQKIKREAMELAQSVLKSYDPAS